MKILLVSINVKSLSYVIFESCDKDISYSRSEYRDDPKTLFFTVEQNCRCVSFVSSTDVRERRDVNPSRRRPEGNEF